MATAHARATRRLLACGAVGGPLFVVVLLLDGATRRGYDPAAHAVSQLSLGDRGWLQTANFVITGLLMTAFAAGLRRALRPGRGALWGPLLAGVFGLALLGSGVFVMDPMRGYPPGAPAGFPPDVSWHHTLHDSLGVVVFTTLPLACLVLARRFATEPGGLGWAAYSAATAVVMLALLVAFGAAWETGGDAAGLLQRAMIAAGWGWVALLAVRLLAGRTRPRRQDPVDGRFGN
jgi:hypothetical protein